MRRSCWCRWIRTRMPRGVLERAQGDLEFARRGVCAIESSRGRNGRCIVVHLSLPGLVWSSRERAFELGAPQFAPPRR